tara:strand:- start:1720 stop:1902 length:183 start_codon:yes stop_codon:yes gene_type:complete
MSNVEDILYKAHNEGIREDVFMEAKVLRVEDPKKWKYAEYSDVLEEAYRRVVEKRSKKNE